MWVGGENTVDEQGVKQWAWKDKNGRRKRHQSSSTPYSSTLLTAMRGQFKVCIRFEMWCALAKHSSDSWGMAGREAVQLNRCQDAGLVQHGAALEHARPGWPVATWCG